MLDKFALYDLQSPEKFPPNRFDAEQVKHEESRKRILINAIAELEHIKEQERLQNEGKYIATLPKFKKSTSEIFFMMVDKEVYRKQHITDNEKAYEIKRSCCEYAGLNQDDPMFLNSRRNGQTKRGDRVNYCVTRQVAMYLTRKNTRLSLREIGYLYGGKDHSTVLHTIPCVQNYIDIKDIFVTGMIKRVTQELKRLQS
jgi:chromosomal replication initiation ATPase DnaA